MGLMMCLRSSSRDWIDKMLAVLLPRSSFRLTFALQECFHIWQLTLLAIESMWWIGGAGTMSSH
jgi:hypothetical protein